MLRSPSPMTQIKFNRFAVYVGGLTPSMCASMKASVSLVELAVFVLGDLPKFSGANSFDDRWYWP